MEWSRLVAAASAGDGMAVDHLIEARLKGELPPSEEQAFEESCFLYWFRDGPYSQEARKNATSHDPEESNLSRDKNASRMDFRFIEASHMSRLLGLGLEGSWDVSVTFHPHSSNKVRVHIVEEPEAPKVDWYAQSRAWQRSGYKLVREWKRARVASVRQNLSMQAFQKRGQLARSVSYIIQCFSSTSKGTSRSAVADLTLKASLGETDEEDPGSSTNILRVLLSATCTATNELGGQVSHRGQIDLYGGSFCSLADWSVKESAKLDVPDSCDAHHGASTLRCNRLDDLSGVGDVSDMQLDTMWLLQDKGMHTFRASVKHELEVARESRKSKLLGRVSRLFQDPVSSVLSGVAKVPRLLMEMTPAYNGQEDYSLLETKSISDWMFLADLPDAAAFAKASLEVDRLLKPLQTEQEACGKEVAEARRRLSTYMQSWLLSTK
ncbi:hypothetical protein KFL_005680070 [Klebsormidium nitens]|uniref:Uncharacterized protein n=1 Tax=Klebsormidium nitens TaxID=105231 RepID=A0A1Y1IG59_KLENI|nr:hypothetical protein KFL_005680070 [Klebsormidium nitens]|eukprot:GAQ89840.1 hypothetical protein KFL_005680070 [Klebsormidium nitens]